jgi:phosphohistidine phosphatase
MKTLCLLRHAKAAWGIGQTDSERVLDDIGQQQAPKMAETLKQAGFVPDRIVTSKAKRALTTAQYMQVAWDFADEKLQTEAQIYEADMEDLLAIVQAFEDKHNTILLVGHNPGISVLAYYLSQRKTQQLPPCGAACFTIASNHWQDVTDACVELQYSKEPSI